PRAVRVRRPPCPSRSSRCAGQLEPLEQLVLDLLELVERELAAVERELRLGEEPAHRNLVVQLPRCLFGQPFRDPDRPAQRRERATASPSWIRRGSAPAALSCVTSRS